MHNRTQATEFAAIFIDFENVFYFLKHKYNDPPGLDDHVYELLRNLKTKLEDDHGLQTIVMKAYADFERLGTPSQGPLYLMGIDTHNVLGTEHKNAADMRLCIDALEVLYTRPEINTFIFVAGDRDYIPVIQHLKRQTRKVMATAFKDNVSGDLLQNVGKNRFIDSMELLSAESNEKLEKRKQEIERVEAEILRKKGLAAFQQIKCKDPKAKELGAKDVLTKNMPSPVVVMKNENKLNSSKGIEAPSIEEEADEFENIQFVEDENELKCLEFILGEVTYKRELWMGPFLRRLNDVFPLLADYERKIILGNLIEKGAVKIEKRRGDPYDFTVMLVNYNHPDVRRLNK